MRSVVGSRFWEVSVQRFLLGRGHVTKIRSESGGFMLVSFWDQVREGAYLF